MILLVPACSDVDRPVAPAVHVITLGGAPMLAAYVKGAAAWSPLGFDVSADPSGLDECGYSWHVFGELDCEITIGIRRDPLLREKHGTDASTSRPERIVTIDTEVPDADLQRIAAHEAGHILLDTADHTQGGIMGGSAVTMQKVDRELACRTIGICI